MTADTASSRPAEFVKALDRGLAVLRTFDTGAPKLTMTDVARRTGMTKAAARRFLLTLVRLGYAHYDGRSYSLRPRALEIGAAYLSSVQLPELATRHLESLAETVRETSSMTVLDGSDVRYIARVHGHRIVTVSIQVGTRFPALVTSTGRILLSDWERERLEALIGSHRPVKFTPHTIVEPPRLLREIDRARERGWALTDQELDIGLRSLAVPIRETAGAVVAAINVSTHTSRASVDSMRREVLPALCTAASSIESDLACAFPEGLPVSPHG